MVLRAGHWVLGSEDDPGRVRVTTVREVLRVLLVEDSPGDAQLFEEELRDAGLHGLDVTNATRMDEALRLYEPGAYDLVLLDLNLPDTKGLRTVERMTGAVRETPVVILTTLADEGLARQAIAVGAEDYLVKGENESWQVARALRFAVARRSRPSPERPWTPAQLDEAAGIALPPSWLGGSGLPSGLGDIRAELEADFEGLIGLAGAWPDQEAPLGLLEWVRACAERLTLLAATPRDVVEVHQAAATNLLMGSTWATARTCASASQRVLVLLLAHLGLAYRAQAAQQHAEDRA